MAVTLGELCFAYVTTPSSSGTIDSHFAAIHVGGSYRHALLSQSSDAAPIRTYPSLHVNVATDAWKLSLLNVGAIPLIGALSAAHDAVGAAVGAAVGTLLGADVGTLLGADVGKLLGAAVGEAVGSLLGADVGMLLGTEVGEAVGTLLGVAVGCEDGAAVGTTLGTDVGAVDGDAVGIPVGEDVSHVGAASDDQPTEPTPATLHVRVVAALIANPTKQ